MNKEELGYLGLLLDFDRPTNLASWFQSALLLLSSLLLLIIYKIKKDTKNKFYFHWFVLSVIPIFLSMDKIMSFHNVFIEIAKVVSEAQGLAHYILIIGITSLIYTFIVVYLALHDDMPKSTQIFLFIAFAIYLEGAIGIELIKQKFISLETYSHFAYYLLLSIREFLETSGVIVLIYALISYISNHIRDIQFLIEDRI